MADFGQALRLAREQAGWSQRRLAATSGVNVATVNRLEHGDRPPSGPAQVLALAEALALGPQARDTLFASAGYWPPALCELGPRDASLRLVARVLTSERVAPAAKARFRQVLATLAEQWLPDSSAAEGGSPDQAPAQAEAGHGSHIAGPQT